MTTVSLQKAQAELGDLLARAEAGEEIVIERGDELPALRLLVAEQATRTGRRGGMLAYELRDLPDDLFLRPMEEDELGAWEGKYSNDHPG